MHDPAPQPKPVVFVARRWDPQEDTLNTRLISLMERAGFTVSTKMDRAVVNNLEHKETVNIIDADAFCLIMTPRSETDTVSLNIQVEIGVAKAFEIPAFVLVDKAHMGGPSLSGTVRAITHGLNNGHTWYEFSRHTLLSGAEDEKLLDFLRSARIAVNDTAPRKREARLLALAALFAKDDRMEPFQNGLRIVANAYDNSSSTLYDAIARAAVSITGAEFGFVGLLEQDHTWTQIGASGFHSRVRGRERSAERPKLGFHPDGTTLGISGHVAFTGEPFISGSLQNDQHALKQEMGLTFVDPGDWKVESEICVPIRLKDKIIGVIDVEDRNPRRFEQIHLILLEWLATVASIAYSADQLESFLKTLGSRNTDVRSFAETILATLSSWSLADHGFIALRLKPNSECTVIAIQDQHLSKEVHSKFSRNELIVEPGRGLAGRALQDGQARYIEDVGSQEEYLTWWTSTVSEIVIPVLQGGAVMGLVNLEFSVKRDFHNLDRELLETLARLLSFTLSHQATERAPQS